MKALLTLIVVSALLIGGAYVIRPLLQTQMGDAERKRLIETGVISNRPVLRQARSMTVSLPGRAMHVRIADPGEGAAGHVILIHGLSTPSYVWRDYFKPLSEAGFMVAAPDLYGRGFSDRVEEPYTERLFLDQIDHLIQALEAPAPVHLVGYSMGAAIALRYAASKPERVETLTLVAPAGFQCGQNLAGWFTLPVIGDWLFTVFGPELFASASANEWAHTKDPDYWRGEYWANANYAGYGPAVLSTLRNFSFVNSCAAARAWSAAGRPTVAIFANNDALIPVSGAVKAAELMPHAKIVKVAEQSHAIVFAQPEAVLSQLLEVLKPPAPQPVKDASVPEDAGLAVFPVFDVPADPAPDAAAGPGPAGPAPRAPAAGEPGIQASQSANPE